MTLCGFPVEVIKLAESMTAMLWVTCGELWGGRRQLLRGYMKEDGRAQCGQSSQLAVSPNSAITGLRLQESHHSRCFFGLSELTPQVLPKLQVCEQYEL